MLEAFPPAATAKAKFCSDIGKYSQGQHHSGRESLIQCKVLFTTLTMDSEVDLEEYTILTVNKALKRKITEL